jgi:hypothetical protein
MRDGQSIALRVKSGRGGGRNGCVGESEEGQRVNGCMDERVDGGRVGEGRKCMDGLIV